MIIVWKMLPPRQSSWKGCGVAVRVCVCVCVCVCVLGQWLFRDGLGLHNVEFRVTQASAGTQSSESVVRTWRWGPLWGQGEDALCLFIHLRNRQAVSHHMWVHLKLCIFFKVVLCLQVTVSPKQPQAPKQGKLKKEIFSEKLLQSFATTFCGGLKYIMI